MFSPAGGGGGKKGKKRGGNQNLVGRATVVRLTASGVADSNFGDEGVVQQDFADYTSGPIANSVLVDASFRNRGVPTALDRIRFHSTTTSHG